MKLRPGCQDARRWVRERIGNKYCFTAFTGQDERAFSAFVHLLELYAVTDNRARVVEAMYATLESTQNNVRHLFKAAIPWALDWGNEERLWEEIEKQQERDFRTSVVIQTATNCMNSVNAPSCPEATALAEALKKLRELK